MSEDNNRNGFSTVEVSMGWNSPPPRMKFPESIDAGDVSTSSNQGGNESVKETEHFEHPNTELLGIYSSLLPGSSPPRPRVRVKKRKPESPLKLGKHTKIVPNEESPDPFTSIRAAPPESQNPAAISMLLDGNNDDDDSDDDDDDLHEIINKQHTETLQGFPSSDDTDSDLEDLIKIPPPLKFVPTYFVSRKILRLIVQRISQSIDKLVLACTNAESESVTLQMEGSWSDTIVKRGDVVHILRLNDGRTCPFDMKAEITLNDQNDLFAIVNPDILVPCTSVAEALSCERQVILRGRVRMPVDLNENLVLGTIKHEFIQSCFTQNLLNDTPKMQLALRAAAEATALDLQLVDLDVPTAINKLASVVPEIQKWGASIWGPKAAGREIEFHRGDDTLRVRLNRAAYIEEEIRSPYLGLVGKIDVTGEAVCCSTTNNNGTGTANGSAHGNPRLAGLEIKTGKNTQSASHRAQTALYTLLLAERHPFNTHPWSLLYYTETGTTIAVTSMISETRSLLQRRNKVAHEMWHLPPEKLPEPTAGSSAICNWCSRSDSCVLYTAAVDGGHTWNLSALTDIYTKARESGNLTHSLVKFYEQWNHLLELEYETWNRAQRLRERQWWVANPTPTAHYVICGQVKNSNDSEGLVYRMKYLADEVPAGGTAEGTPRGTVVVGTPSAAVAPALNPDDFIIVSTKQHMGVTFGIVLGVDGSEVIIHTRHRLFASAKYRIDVEVWSSDSHLALARFNIDSLLHYDRLRELIVDLREPKFTTLSSRKFQNTIDWASSRVLPASQEQEAAVAAAAAASTADLEVSEELSIEESSRNLNEDQTQALNKVLTAKDYALILGMPGTGKTTTIAAIVASLVEKGKSVLLSAYTNSAVDTIVLKLLSANVRCLRLTARVDNVHPDVRSVAVSGNGESAAGSGGGASLVDFLDCPVIACTSHSTSNKLFALRQFDYCILDEASQITLPFSLGPLRLASTFVLVGDHFQLPPLVRNLQAKEQGLTESLFKILCEKHPSAVVELRKQYRMCADIMSLSSDLVYNGRLVCGSELVANQKLELELSKADREFANIDAIDPDNRVVFLNTDTLGSQAYEQTHEGGGISNNAEATIIESVVHQFAKSGLNLNDLAVISVYRQQLSVLTENLKKCVASGLEVLTADQAQGRDKSCIIVSLVRSNERSHSGELLKDWRRLNVAFTRAKKKLIIIGSKRTMQRAEGVQAFFEYIERRKWVVDAKLP